MKASSPVTCETSSGQSVQTNGPISRFRVMTALEESNTGYLIGCAPGWIQRYLRDKRFMADPFVEYARRNVTPVLGSMLGLAEGASKLAVDARRYG